MPDPIRVLHVIRLMNHGGVESMIMNLYRNIDRTKIQFDFVQNSSEPAVYDEEILSLGGRIYHCPHYNGKNHFAYTGWWHDFFRSHPNEYPIVHGHLGSTAAIYLSIAKKYGSFAIAHSHSAGAGSLSYRLFAYPTRFVADQFFACSAEAASARYGGRVAGDSKKCRVINNAIDAAKFAFDADARKKLRQEWGIPEAALVIGHLGRFRREKNHMFLLEVFEAIHRDNPNALLLLVGDGELRREIEAKIRELGLADWVILAGTRSNTWEYYSAMDVFVLPSLYEGLPVSLVEAQASGLPCVVSANVPAESAITDLVRFVSLESDNVHWRKQIMELVRTPRRNMLEQIREAGFDIESTARWLADYYIEVVNKHG